MKHQLFRLPRFKNVFLEIPIGKFVSTLFYIVNIQKGMDIFINTFLEDSVQVFWNCEWMH